MNWCSKYSENTFQTSLDPKQYFNSEILLTAGTVNLVLSKLQNSVISEGNNPDKENRSAIKSYISTTKEELKMLKDLLGKSVKK
jgi:hypothetical protein